MPRTAALVLLAVIAMSGPARTQEEAAGGSFITPFPVNDVYQVRVVGDSLGDGLLYGLVEAFTGDTRVTIDRKVGNITGLMRANYEQQVNALEESLAGQAVDITIIMAGAWDRVSVRGADGNRLLVGSDEWKAEYARRVDRLVRMLKKKKSAVYWIGLPVVRKANGNETVQMMNEIARERAYINGQKFIDAYAGFVDEGGGYSAYGPDLTGKIRLLRSGDEFTGTGYRKLAHFVERDVKRDIATAKTERAIPLAGTEAEQARVNAPKAAKAPDAASPDGAASKPATPQAAASPWTPTAAQVASAGGDQKADPGRVSFKAPGAAGREETVTLDIPRPPISASVLALVTRRESPERLSQMGDALVDQVPGGLTIMNSITPASESGAGLRRKVSPTQSPFFRVLVRGEHLTSKPGRVDDASWPKPEPAATRQPSAALTEPGKGTEPSSRDN